MLGFRPIGSACIGEIVGLSIAVITVTPPTQVGQVGVPTDPFTIAISAPFHGLIDFASSIGSVAVPSTLSGPGTIRIIPAGVGVDVITVTNMGGAINPAPILLTVTHAPTPPAPAPQTRLIHERVVNPEDVAQTSRGPFQWVWFDQPAVAALLQPMDQGDGLFTDSNGYITLMVRSDLDVGQYGIIGLSDSDDSDPLNPPDQGVLVRVMVR